MELEEHRRRRKAFLIACFGGGLILGIVSELLKLATGSHEVAFIPLAVWGAVTFYHGARVTRATCPRCGRLFYLLGFINLFPVWRSCVHCGLPLFEKPTVEPVTPETQG